ncbi:MAG TPA: tripartite tricarboxylate transporter substrate-binding protein [Candidatus Acidoferrales bacterium]|nr:tripartite tricarboxylate transporter substrate-binding protein [Candidatus Acidoferrales bacterium]
MFFATLFLTLIVAAPFTRADQRTPAPPQATLAQLSRQAATARPFYEGKTIHLIIPFAPAGTTDIGARIVAKYLGRHIPGNPAVIAQNMPGAGGMIGANHLYSIAKPDGLTIATISRAHYLEQMIGRPEVRFDFRKFSWIGSFNSALMFLACRSDSGFTSLDKIRGATKPARIGQGSSGSISFVFSSLVEEALNFKFHNVMGYKSGRDTDLGMERGEVDCRASSDVTTGRAPWREWVEKRFVTFILQQGPKKSRVLPKEIPTVYELASPDAKPVLNLMDVMLAYTEFAVPFAAPPSTPAEPLRALRAGFEKMLADPEFGAEAKKLVDWDGSYLTGEQLQAKIDKTVTQPPEVIKRIKEILQ